MQKVLLVILDGWGEAPASACNAITSANPSFFNYLNHTYPHAQLITHGSAVGLPEGQMGNSEVGHLNIGAGRIVYQDLQRINEAIRSNELFNNPALVATINYCIDMQKPLHLMGLVSTGGVHSHLNHLLAICQYLKKTALLHVYIHVFTDGRDTSPHAALTDIATLQYAIKNSNIRLATLQGRYYAMDRDQRWERTSLAYQLLVHKVGNAVDSLEQGIRTSYKNKCSDEFIAPMYACNTGFEGIANGDAVLCFNFRTDRCRQITQALTQQPFELYNMQPLQLHYTTLTRYDEQFKDVNVLFEKDNLLNTLGETLAERGIRQMRFAETEKYPHVTFFFSGGRERVFTHEHRVLHASPKVATYDLQPTMSAVALTQSVVSAIENDAFDFGVINFANADMVGHTGVFDAVVAAIQTVDSCLKKIVEAAQRHTVEVLIIADHGNAECMKNPDGSVHTAHTLNPVPVLVCNVKFGLKNGILADVAPTILALMQVPQPAAMTGSSLLC